MSITSEKREEVRDALELMMTKKMNNEEVQKALKEFTRTFLFTIPDLDASYVVELTKGRVTRGPEEGTLKRPNITVTANSDVFMGIRNKEINVMGAFINGDLKITGPFRDLMKFKKLL